MEKNIYFNILKIYIDLALNIKISIKNITTEDFNICIDNKIIKVESNNILDTTIVKNKIIIITDHIEKEFEIKINNLEKKGFGGNSIVETPQGKIEIKNIIAGNHVLDKLGTPLLVKNVYVYTIDNNSTNKPIFIDKSKCGLNLPYTSVVMSMKTDLKIKKVTLKGRSLFLNGKAKIFEFVNFFNYYAIETENNKEYLISGFVTDSI